MAHPADKGDEEVREGTETLKSVAEDIEREGTVRRTIQGQEEAEDQPDQDDEASDESADEASGEFPMGGFGRASNTQQN